jgi:2-polyprenyl-3-methyl-5-hydroxy-6-metoxy-1,4-benzoquinol methylase
VPAVLTAAGIIEYMSDPPPEPQEVVRLGYDQLSASYRSDDADPEEYRGWTDELLGALPLGSRVLDVGCGNGVPVARRLVGGGHQVTGLDISERRIVRARKLVPVRHF